MQSPSTANLTPPNRQESLRLWLTRTGNTFRALGGKIGISGGALSALCGQETIPTRRHAQMVALGVPAELLPRPADLKPGPKRKPKPLTHDAAMAAFRGL